MNYIIHPTSIEISTSQGILVRISPRDILAAARKIQNPIKKKARNDWLSAPAVQSLLSLRRTEKNIPEKKFWKMLKIK